MGDSNAEGYEGAGNGKILWDRSVYGGDLKDSNRHGIGPYLWSIGDWFGGKGKSADGSDYNGKFLGSKHHGIRESTNVGQRRHLLFRWGARGTTLDGISNSRVLLQFVILTIPT